MRNFQLRNEYGKPLRIFFVPVLYISSVFISYMLLKITKRAGAQLRTVALQENIDLSTSHVRLKVVQGGCSGLTYDLGWDTEMQKGDFQVDIDGLSVVVDQRSRLYLDGIELDFTDGLEGRGFHFSNPQASRTCACGESFGL